MKVLIIVASVCAIAFGARLPASNSTLESLPLSNSSLPSVSTPVNSSLPANATLPLPASDELVEEGLVPEQDLLSIPSLGSSQDALNRTVSLRASDAVNVTQAVYQEQNGTLPIPPQQNSTSQFYIHAVY